MRNWPKLVRERLGVNELDRRISDGVVSELAGRRAETYHAARVAGLDDSAAFERTLQEVGDCRVLAADIRQAKEDPMNHRTRTLWLPALITLLGASLSLALTQMLKLHPRVLWIGGWGLTIYWQWLATLPLFGAAGTYISRRAQGSVGSRFAAGLSPALAMLGAMSVILPFALAIDGFYAWRLVGFGLGLINWVAVPALALMLGALPFLRSGTEIKA